MCEKYLKYLFHFHRKSGVLQLLSSNFSIFYSKVFVLLQRKKKVGKNEKFLRYLKQRKKFRCLKNNFEKNLFYHFTKDFAFHCIFITIFFSNKVTKYVRKYIFFRPLVIVLTKFSLWITFYHFQGFFSFFCVFLSYFIAFHLFRRLFYHFRMLLKYNVTKHCIADVAPIFDSFHAPLFLVLTALFSSFFSI